MRGGRVVKATTWARLRVAACPGGGIDCEDRRPVHWPVGDKEPAQPVLVDPALAECLVEDAVAAGELWLEAERGDRGDGRSEEHTSELQSLRHLVCRLLLEKKK